MTNCEKCGNPLQPGSTSCPICGTTAKPADAAPAMTPAAPIEQFEALDETPMVSPAPAPVAPAPVAPVPQTIEPGPMVAPAAPAPAPVQPAAPEMTAPTFVAPTPAQPAAPVAAPTPAQPMSPTPEPIQPAQPFGADQGFGGMPAAPMQPASPIQPAAIPAPAAPAPVVEQKKEEKKAESSRPAKKGNNGTLVVLVGIVALALGLGIGYLLSPSLKASPAPAPVVEVADTETQRVSGFNFDMKTDWSYNDYYDKVIINDPESLVTIRLALYSGVFTNINTTNIELSLSTKQGYSDVKVEKTTIGERDVVTVNASNGDLRIQYYYIAHNTEKMILITTVYETEEAKKTHEENVKKLVESTTYTDEVQNAIQVIDSNSQYFDDSTYVFYDSFNKEEPQPIA